MSEPVVITGMGAVSCLGEDVESLWRGLIEARSGIGPLQKIDAQGLRNTNAGEVRNWNSREVPDWADGLDAAALFALSAAAEACAQAGIGSPDPDTGVVLATNFGGTASLQAWASGGTADYRNSSPSIATDAVARLARATGPRATLSLSCSSGAAAMGLAADWIRVGRARRVIAGGYDSLTLYSLSGLSCLRTVTTGRIQPFDRNRTGTVFGEGAGIVVLEALSSALQRGAEPLCTLRGWATNNNAYHLTAPEKDGAGQERVMRSACASAGLTPGDLDYVNAHGTGTRYNDSAETAALHSLLGEAAYRIPVSSIKAAISHTMGAAGALEAIACVQALRTGWIPPTLNWEERDPECDLDYVPNQAREHSIKKVLSLSSGIGGNNAAVVLEKYEN